MNVYQSTTAFGQKIYKIESDDPKNVLKSPNPEESEEMTTGDKMMIAIIIALFGAFVLFVFPDVVFILIFVIFSGGIMLVAISLLEVFNPETRIAGKTYYPWADGSPASLKQLIKADKQERFANNRVCSVCGDKLTASQTTCQCGHIVNCIICYQPIYSRAVVFDCCLVRIHANHLTSITSSCPYCKTSLPRFAESEVPKISVITAIKQTYAFQNQSYRVMS